MLKNTTKSRIILTSALPFVNNIPHLGNIIGCVLPADVIARYHRIKGNEVYYICGADEYGTATETKAREEGLSPRELCDKYYVKHKEIYDWFNIKFDVFGRTSTPNPRTDDHFHTFISQDIFKRLYNNGYLEEREISQLFCPSINRFVADRFIIGICPKCGHNKARGDQCDKCQAIYESSELLNPYLRGDENVILEPRTSKHLFLRLDLLQPQIQKWFETVKHKWAANAVSITESWLKKGLQPRCITRDMEWGTPLPDIIDIEGKEHKVMYNWFDAPIGYISIAGRKLWDDQWWSGEYPTRLIQFMGIDNVPFHSILFPGSLIGTKQNYALVSEIVSVHYLNFEGGKFSKTENRGIFGDEVMKMGIHHDYWRYYLMKIRAEDGLGLNGYQRGDANFTWDDFIATCNADLCNNYGNLVHRTFSLTHKYCNGVLDSKFEPDSQIQIKMYDLIEKCDHAYESNMITSAISCALELSTIMNKYLTESAPWILYKTNPKNHNISNIIGTALSAVWTITTMLNPIIPKTTDKILSYIKRENSIIRVKSGFVPFFQPIKISINYNDNILVTDV
jgi:methionyl-tRNA synthetase